MHCEKRAAERFIHIGETMTEEQKITLLEEWIQDGE